jgi:hypothetical protein
VKSYRISKGDFWEYKNSPMPVGILSISTSDAVGEASAEFNEKEEILTARIITKQTFDGVPLEIRSWMAAVSDVFITEIKSCANDLDADLRITLEGYVNGNRPVTAEVRDDCIIVTRSTLGAEADDPKSHTPVYISKTAIASRIIGADAALGRATACSSIERPPTVTFTESGDSRFPPTARKTNAMAAATQRVQSVENRSAFRRDLQRTRSANPSGALI